MGSLNRESVRNGKSRSQQYGSDSFETEYARFFIRRKYIRKFCPHSYSSISGLQNLYQYSRNSTHKYLGLFHDLRLKSNNRK